MNWKFIKIHEKTYMRLSKLMDEPSLHGYWGRKPSRGDLIDILTDIYEVLGENGIVVKRARGLDRRRIKLIFKEMKK